MGVTRLTGPDDRGAEGQSDHEDRRAEGRNRALQEGKHDLDPRAGEEPRRAAIACRLAACQQDIGKAAQLGAERHQQERQIERDCR